MRICSYKLKAIEFLDLVNGDMDLGVTILCSTIKVQSYEDSILKNVLSILMGFLTPSENIRDEAFLILFTSKANQLLLITMSSHLLETFIDSIHTKWFARSCKGAFDATQHEIMIFFLNYIQSLCLYATDGLDHFRQHLLVATSIYPKLLSSYVNNCKTLFSYFPSCRDVSLAMQV